MNDYSGHGTQSAVVAASRRIKTKLYGTFPITIEGAVSAVELYSYKITWKYYNFAPENFMEACKAAIRDEVDIISVSLSHPEKHDYYTTFIAHASFLAMKHGILTVAAGGNYGPLKETVRNFAPWMVTVGASTSEKTFRTRVKLGSIEVEVIVLFLFLFLLALLHYISNNLIFKVENTYS
jgi:hypothetical protein